MGGEFAHPPLINLILGMFTWREEDPRRQIILAPYVFCFQFTCKAMYWIFIAEWWEDPSARDKTDKNWKTNGGGPPPSLEHLKALTFLTFCSSLLLFPMKVARDQIAGSSCGTFPAPP